MEDVQNDMLAKLVGVVIVTAAGAVFAAAANKLVNRIFNVHCTIMTKRWLTGFAVSTSTNLIIFILFTTLYVLLFNMQKREMTDIEVAGIILVGVVSPLINSIVCILVQPQNVQKSFIAGTVSFFATFAYVTIMLYLYMFVFKGVSRVTGL